jgi:tetratricopeptide (TPR) repeat protein
MKNSLIFIFIAIISMSLYANTITELLLKAEQAIEEDEYEMALEYYDQAIKLEPKNAEVYYLRGIVNFEETDDDLALNDFNKAIEIGFDKIDIYYHRGLAYESLVEYENAVNDLTIFLNHESKKSDEMLISSYETRGWCNYDMGNMAGALEDYSKVIEIDPMKFGPHNMQATIFLLNKQYDKSMNTYKNMLKLFPKAYKKIRYGMIRVKNKSGDFEGALEDCAQLMQEGYTKFSIFLLRAEAYIGTNEYQLALDDVNTAIEKNSISIQMHNLKAKAYLGLGKYDEAEKAINVAVKLYPEFDEYLKTKEDIEKAIMNKKK